MKTESDFLSQNVKENFGILKKWTNHLSGDEAYENYITLLTHTIAKLIENDYQQLITILYTNDIDEAKVKHCFDATKTTREIARDIAQLYLERLRKKWETRQLYDNSTIIGDWD